MKILLIKLMLKKEVILKSLVKYRHFLSREKDKHKRQQLSLDIAGLRGRLLIINEILNETT